MILFATIENYFCLPFVGMILSMQVYFAGDSLKRTVSQLFAASVSVQSDDASQVFRTFDTDFKYERKTDKRQFEIADELGISYYHGGVVNRNRDRISVRFAAQSSQRKISGSTNMALEGPLFPKRDLLVDPFQGRYLSASKGGLLNPAQLSVNAGVRVVVFKGGALDMSFPALMLHRKYDLQSRPTELQKELFSGASNVVFYSTGATAIFNLNLPVSKSFAVDGRSFLFLNGYRFKYQQWNQEIRFAWLMRKNVEWVLQMRFSEDRTVAPKVMKWYSIRLGYRVGRVRI
ncbi:MAG: hypothetical protein ACKO0X_02585 [Bacteroidota bacterium]